MSSAKITLKVEFNSKGFKSGLDQINRMLATTKSNIENMSRTMGKSAERAAQQQIKAARNAARSQQRDFERATRSAQQAAKAQMKAAENSAKVQIKAAQNAAKAAVKAAQQQAQAAQQAANSSSNSFKSASNSMSNSMSTTKKITLGVFAAIAAAATGLAAVIGGQNGAMKMAMTYEGAMNQIDRALGENAGEFKQWIHENSAALGMGEAAMMQYGATFSGIMKNTFKDTARASQETAKLLSLASNISTATGRSTEDVLERLRSGYMGNTEAIEDLGIYVNAATIKSTEAFRKFAGDQSWESLDQNTRNLILNAAIMEQGFAAYGDVLSNTLSGKHNTLMAELSNLKLMLGQAFAPIYSAILPGLTAMVKSLQRVIITIGQFVRALFGSKEAAKGANSEMGKQTKTTASTANNVGEANNNMNKLAKSTKKAGNAAKKAANNVQGFDILNKMADPSAANAATDAAKDAADAMGNIGGGATAGGAFEFDNVGGESWLDEMNSIPEGIQELADKIKDKWEKVKEAWTKGKEFLFGKKDKDGNLTSEGFIKKSMPWLAGLLTAIGSYLAITKFAGIATMVKTGLSLIGAIFAGISWPVVAIAALIGLIVVAIIDLWKNNETFRDNVISIWTNLKDLIMNLWESYLKPILTSLKEMFIAIWEEGVKPLWDKFKEFIADFVEMVAVIIEALKPTLDFIVTNVGPIFATIFDGVAKAVGTAVNVILGVVGDLIDVLSGLIKFITGVFQGDWGKAWEGIKELFGSIFNGIVNIASGVVNVVIDIINGMIGAIEKALNLVVEKVNSLSWDVPDWVPFIGGESFSPNLPTVSIKKISHIPKLAQGGVIPPNNPRLFIGGDNRKEDEIIAPESKLRNMGLEIAAMSNDGPGNDLIAAKLDQLIALMSQGFNLNLDGKVAGQLVHEGNTANYLKTGKTQTFNL